MEASISLWIHSHATSTFDSIFVLSHWLGNTPFCTALVIVAVIINLLRRNPGLAVLWIVLGLSTFFLQAGVKELVARVRPELWPRLVEQGGYSFPSGHALAAATFYPLIAFNVARTRPRLARIVWPLAILMAIYVGFGRLYLGVHWFTDVAAGWTLGGVQTAIAIWVYKRNVAGGPDAPTDGNGPFEGDERDGPEEPDDRVRPAV
jgi:membrane-associated phospholipid phosphatase